jgi:broad specificity phosphatase PhoE
MSKRWGFFGNGESWMTVTCLILVRHGETEWNRVERFRGRADVPLNATGLAQAEATARRIAHTWQPVAIFASPLSRAVQTAEAIARQCGLAAEPQPDLIDIDFGQWQGLTPGQVGEQWPELLARWYTAPHTVEIPDGETLAQLRMRAMAVVSALIERYRGQTILLVGHTVLNRVLLLAMLGLGNERFWRIRQGTCAINVVEEEAGDWTLVTLNDTAHLQSDYS